MNFFDVLFVGLDARHARGRVLGVIEGHQDLLMLGFGGRDPLPRLRQRVAVDGGVVGGDVARDVGVQLLPERIGEHLGPLVGDAGLEGGGGVGLGRVDRLFEPADSAAGTPMAAPSASERPQSSSAAASSRRERGVVRRRVVSTAIETGYTPESCVSLRPGGRRRGPHRMGRRWATGDGATGVRSAVVLAVAFALRLWGIKQGLPYVYDVDEYGHFVPEAVAMFDHGLNPHYFINPPALTYLLHVVFGVWFGGLGSSSPSISHEFALHPDRFSSWRG